MSIGKLAKEYGVNNEIIKFILKKIKWTERISKTNYNGAKSKIQKFIDENTNIKKVKYMWMKENWKWVYSERIVFDIFESFGDLVWSPPKTRSFGSKDVFEMFDIIAKDDTGTVWIQVTTIEKKQFNEKKLKPLLKSLEKFPMNETDRVIVYRFDIKNNEISIYHYEKKEHKFYNVVNQIYEDLIDGLIKRNESFFKHEIESYNIDITGRSSDGMKSSFYKNLEK